MRLLPLTLFCVLFHATALQSQQIDQHPPIQFGNIPEEDLKMTVYDRDSSAEAVVLCDFETVEITINNDVLVKKMRHTRIKILNTSGYGYGDVVVPYYSHKKSGRFFFDKAAIYLPDGTVEELNKKDVFDERVTEYYSTARFTFPKIEPGCIIEYVYYVNSESYYDPEDWFFQREIPVRHSEIRFVYPKQLQYNYFFQGNESMKLVPSEEGTTVYDGLNGTCTIAPGKFIFENAPAMRPEKYITTMDDYRARIRFQLAQINHYDGRIQTVTDTWPNLRKELETSDYFGRHYLKKGYYKDITDPVAAELANLPNEYEKASFAYDYITKKISWNGRHSMYGGAERIEDLFEKGVGTSGQVNIMLLVLLREAGIEAAPVLTSTRSHGKMYEDFPILDQFDHMLIHAVIDGKPFFLDATEPLRPIGYPDTEALNGRGWHLEKGWMDIKAPGESMDAFFTQLTLSPDGSVQAQLLGAYTGYNAVPERRHHIKDKNGNHWSKRFSARYTDVKVEQAGCSDVHTLSGAFKDTVTVNIEQAAMVAGDLMYFSPVLYSSFTESPFKQKERLYPVDFPYRIREQHNMKIILPENYRVEELPENHRVVLPGGAGDFLYAAEEKAPGLVTVTISFSVRQLRFYPEEYAAIKELFDRFVEKLGEQVVLRKVE